MPSPLPYFKFFARDWLSSSTRALSLAARGAYIDLLSHQWEAGDLPSTPAELARLVGVGVSEFKKVWKEISGHFELTSEGRLINPKLRAIQDEASGKRAKNIENGGKGGKKSAEQRRNPPIKSVANAQANGAPNAQPNAAANGEPNGVANGVAIPRIQNTEINSPCCPPLPAIIDKWRMAGLPASEIELAIQKGMAEKVEDWDRWFCSWRKNWQRDPRRNRPPIDDPLRVSTREELAQAEEWASR